MIYKSYIIEKNFDLIDKNIILFYGENLGLKNEFKNKIKKKYKKNNYELLIYEQEQILKNPNSFINEIQSKSLFQKQKILFVNNVSDKFLTIFEEIKKKTDNEKIFLFSEILDKKSKIRAYLETSKDFGIVACYEDNELGIKKLINNKLRDFSGLSVHNINLIAEHSNFDRSKLNNEIEKITTFFLDKNIKTEQLEKLLDTRINKNFNTLRDCALSGNKIETNKLLADTEIEDEKNFYYLNLINQRLNMLKTVNETAKTCSLEIAINSMKPPIFWKDKPVFIEHLKKWRNDKIRKIQTSTYKIELEIKSNSTINKNILIKKLIVDICQEANA